MQRESQIPFLLWLPAAVIFHAVSGGTAAQGAKVMAERAEILAFSRSVRHEIRGGMQVTIELMGDLGPTQEPGPKPKRDESDDEPNDDESATESEPARMAPPKPAPKTMVKRPPPKPLPKPLPKKVLPAPPKPLPKPPPKKVAKKPPAPKPASNKKKAAAPLIVPAGPDKRIAVINDPSLKKGQRDNPDAKRIADHANKTDQETMARHRAYDQNVSKPTGGGQPAPVPLKAPGNGVEERPGFSNEVKGSEAPRAGSEKGPPEPPQKPIARTPKGSNKPKIGQHGRAEVLGQKSQAAGKGPASLKPMTAGGGNWSINPDGGDGKKQQRAKKGRRGVAGRRYIPGVVKPGVPPKYGISAHGLVEALGTKHLRREQEKARSTRLARHRGSLKAGMFQKYRAAIENYDPTVKLGNQTSLNAAKVPFASYINRMHNRIHPIFAGGFLASLNKLPDSAPLNNQKLVTHVELIMDGKTGKLISAGVVKPSGITAFEVGALRSLEMAGPFGEPPGVIVSPDGKVYLHWEFYRNPFYACTSRFAHPYMLKKTPAKESPKPPAKPPAEPRGEERRASQDAPLRPERKRRR